VPFEGSISDAEIEALREKGYEGGNGVTSSDVIGRRQPTEFVEARVDVGHLALPQRADLIVPNSKLEHLIGQNHRIPPNLNGPQQIAMVAG